MESSNSRKDGNMNVPAKINLAMQLVMTGFAEKIRIGKPSIPASTHSLRVGLSLITYGYSIEIILAGFCHDLLEDTETNKTTIERLFGNHVRFLTEACTISQNLNAEAGETDLLTRVRRHACDNDIGPLVIKCADSLDNLKTNWTLKPEHQLEAWRKGRNWLTLANQFLSPDNILTEDLRSILNREEKRLRGLGILEN